MRIESAFGFNGWSPVTPSPPPIYADRLSGAFINRAPVRQTRAEDAGKPQKQDPRLTAATEKIAIVLNALLRRAEIIRVGTNDFRLSWLIPHVPGDEALNLTIFYDTDTNLISYKDENGVVIPIGGGGGGSGTVLSFSFTDANGFTGVVTTPTTTPNLTLTLDEIDGGGA
jgi:hypothetical protein